VEKRNYTPISYNYLDSQRLKDTFFSTPPKKPSRQKIILFTALSFSLLVITIFAFNYNLILIPRRGIKVKKNITSLIRNNMISSFKLLGGNNHLMKARRSFIHLTIPPQNNAGIRIDLKKCANLNNNDLLIYLQKPITLSRIDLVIKDVFFHSNSLQPLTIDITNIDDNSPYIKIPIKSKDISLQNTNLYKINQLNFYFHPEDKEKTNQVLIKELALVNNNT
jgi:hypothetical protein